MTNQIEKTRTLARAFNKLDKAEAAYLAAKRDLDVAFQPWAAGKRACRDEARQQLVSTGYLQARRIGA